MAAQPLPQLKFTPDELREMAAIAKRRGFTDLTAYLREIVKADVEQLDEDDDENLLTPEEGFRQGWEDIQAGRVMSSEEFHRRMMQDDN